MEQTIGKPIVSSTASISGSFQPLGIKVERGFGQLLASL
jgi:hypothetical protein